MDSAAVSEDNAELVAQFIAVTGAETQIASFFLESHNFDLQSALHSFYEDPNPDADPNPNSNRHTTQLHDPAADEDDDVEDDDDDDYLPEEEEAAPTPPQPVVAAGRARGEKRPARVSGGRSNIRGFGDLNRNPGSDDEDEDDQGQEYYTGGEKSGMLVQDPNRRRGVDSLFEQARRLGATNEHYRPSSSSRSFTGTGRTLAGETVSSAPQPPEDVVHNIYFWSNGFAIDDGPLRRFDDPQNGPFLESIRKSECPKELEPADKKTQVHVNLIRREEKYQEPVRRRSAFQGVGRALGSGESSESSVKETTKASEPSGNVQSESQSPPMGLTVDDSLPCTSIQLRLADGTRMVACFNTTHTIGHIRAFIDASRPGARNYQLQTVGFPPLQLNDSTKTIEEAGLANSVVIQKSSNP